MDKCFLVISAYQSIHEGFCLLNTGFSLFSNSVKCYRVAFPGFQMRVSLPPVRLSVFISCTLTQPYPLSFRASFTWPARWNDFFSLSSSSIVRILLAPPLCNPPPPPAPLPPLLTVNVKIQEWINGCYPLMCLDTLRAVSSNWSREPEINVGCNCLTQGWVWDFIIINI